MTSLPRSRWVGIGTNGRDPSASLRSGSARPSNVQGRGADSLEGGLLMNDSARYLDDRHGALQSETARRQSPGLGTVDAAE